MAEQALDRGDFLRLLGLAAGVAGVSTIAAAQAGDGGGKGKYLIVLSHGSDDPNRATLGLLLAQVALKKGLGAVHVWMTLGGAEVAHLEKVKAIDSPIFKKFGTAAALVTDIKERGGVFKVCPPCADAAGAKGGARPAFIEEAGGDWLLENLPGAQVVWL